MIRQAHPARRVRTYVAAAVLTVGGLITTACSGGGSTPPPPSATSAAPPSGAPHARPHGLHGKITAENGNTWTVTNAKGTAYTVNIAPTTAFGTKKAPANQQSFPVGDQVVVRGKRTGTTIAATRITAGHPKPAPTAPSSSPAPAG